MWEVAYAEDENNIPVGKNRFDFFRKKHPKAMDLLWVRLEMVIQALNLGRPPREVLQRGWVHFEGSGVFAIDPGNPPLRLYCCLDEKNRRVIILTLGDKRRQGADIQDARKWAAAILKG